MSCHLGSSKAMIESVMLCPQEESNWPIAEPAVLKKKFNDIFGNAHHIKTIKSIKDKIKELQEENQAKKIDLEGFKARKIYAEKLKMSLADLLKTIQSKQQSLAAIDRKLADANDKLMSCRAKHRSVQEAEKAYTQLMHKKEILTKSITELSRHLKERSESDEELQRIIRNYSQEAETRHRAKEEAEKEVDDLNRKLVKKKEELSSLILSITRLEVSDEENSVRIQDRINLIKSLDEKFELGISTQLDSDEATSRLTSMLNINNESLKREKSQARESESKLRDTIHSIKSEKATIEKSVKDSELKRDQHNKDLQNIRDQLNGIRVTQEMIVTAKKSLHEKEELLKDLRIKVNSENIDSQIKSLKNTMSMNEKEEALLKTNIAIMRRDEELRSNIAFKRSNMKDKQKLADEIFEQNEEDIERYIGSVPTQEKLEYELSAQLRENQKRLQALIEKQNKNSRSVSEVTTKIVMTRENLEKMEDEANSIEESIERICADKSLSERILTLDKTVMSLERNLAVCKYEKTLYGTFLKEAQDDKICTICSTHMKGEHLNSVVERLEKSQEEILAQLNNLQRTISIQRNEQEKLKFIRGPSYQLDSLRHDKIPPLRDSLESLILQKSSVDEELKKTSNIRSNVERLIESIKCLLKQAETMTYHLNEAKSIESEVLRMESKLRHPNSDKTIAEQQRALEDLSMSGKEISAEIVELMERKSKLLNAYHAAETNVMSAREQVTRLEEAIERKETLTNQLELDTKKQQKLQTVVEQMNLRLTPLMSELQEKSALLERTLTKNSQKQEALEHKVFQIKQDLSKLERISHDIKIYQERGSKAQLNKLVRTKSSIDSDIEKISKFYQVKAASLRNLEDDLSDHERAKRELESLIQCRKYKAELSECQSKASEMERENFAGSNNTLQHEIQHLEKTRSNLSEERASISGAIAQIEEQKENYREELEGTYKNAESEYLRMTFEVRMREGQLSDVKKYKTGYEMAIVEKQSDKIKEINQVIKELWEKTYTGSDIEYMAIRTDLDDISPGDTTAHTFNYKVVMGKDGEEVNARGRLSAGQKAMASIIIRLALADVFYTDCSAIALDEPTTNLDHDNIQSLASGIANLVKDRLQHRGFQLIIITHDEKFVNTLATQGLANNFYRVCKDDNKYSTIELQNSTVIE
ncbi:hypothetical protein J3Q64DRAFT_1081492 [Phycomyces blakesleeanus]